MNSALLFEKTLQVGGLFFGVPRIYNQAGLQL